MKYKVLIERREVMREILEIEAACRSEAEDLAMEQIEEHDWTDNTIVHANEVVAAVESLGTKRFIIERDSKVTITDYVAIEAETLEEAIQKSSDLRPYQTEEFPDELEPYSYRDSHEASDEEWEEATT